MSSLVCLAPRGEACDGREVLSSQNASSFAQEGDLHSASSNCSMTGCVASGMHSLHGAWSQGGAHGEGTGNSWSGTGAQMALIRVGAKTKGR